MDVFVGSMPDFNYNTSSPYGPAAWGTLSKDWQLCKYGKNQSPIAIDLSDYPVNESLGSLQYKYMPSEGVLVNTGHTVQVRSPTYTKLKNASTAPLLLHAELYQIAELFFATISDCHFSSIKSHSFSISNGSIAWTGSKYKGM
jgi:carbonic anhydrase